MSRCIRSVTIVQVCRLRITATSYSQSYEVCKCACLAGATRAANVALLAITMLQLQDTKSADAALGSSRCHRQGNVACKRRSKEMVETIQSRSERAHHVPCACVLCDDGPALQQ